MLARHAVQLIRTGLKLAGNIHCRASLRNRLRIWDRIATTIQEVGAVELTGWRDVLPPAEAAEIARRVGVKPRNYPHRYRRRS